MICCLFGWPFPERPLAPTKRYISSVGLRKKRLIDYTTELTLDEKVDEKGRYFVMRFSAAKPLTDNQAVDILEMAQAYKAETIKRTLDKELEATMAEAEADKEAQAGDGDGEGEETPSAEQQEMPGWMGNKKKKGQAGH